ncbi:MAG TPA: NAD(P)H-dependent oxidoreductase subunit E [Magnetospirillaceae bacterium]|nr:NAD(P)H-dependent oxidoreductase subunit E [Magnetospirillaceae bacterium]
MEKMDAGKGLQEIVRRYDGLPGALLGILEEAQRADEHSHLSEEALRLIAETTKTPLSEVYSVATFYSFFNLKPQGRHAVVVCRGTACHTRGSLALLEEAADRLGFPDFREDEEQSFTTGDRLFTVRTVACFGQCALAPVVAVDGVIHSRVSTGRILSLLENLRKGGRR